MARPRLLIFIVHPRLVQDARHKGKTITGALCVSAGQSVKEFQNRFGTIGKKWRPSIRPQERSSRITSGWPIQKTSINYFSHRCPQLLAKAHRVKGYNASPFSTESNIGKWNTKVSFTRGPREVDPA